MNISTPAGYEGIVYWRDRPHGAGSWEAAYRLTGSTWWTIASSTIGHAYVTEAWVREVAEQLILQHIEIAKNEHNQSTSS
jgi:hypothetical protein